MNRRGFIFAVAFSGFVAGLSAWVITGIELIAAGGTLAVIGGSLLLAPIAAALFVFIWWVGSQEVLR